MSGKFFLYKYEIGDVVSMRKAHPCGSFKLEVLSLGGDCKLKCVGCGRFMTMPRTKLEKATLDVEKAQQ